jgi:hypothetical protein
MSKNVTLRMDENLLQTLRHKAVDANMSLSAWIVDTLKKSLDEFNEQHNIKEQALMRLNEGFSLGGIPLDRDDLYAR